MAPSTNFAPFDITQPTSIAGCIDFYDDRMLYDGKTISQSGSYYFYVRVPAYQKKKETKKQRILRIAKEKMLASWKTYNQKTPYVIDMKQLCKPKHKLFLQKLR